ncbi:MAG: J domain-containing protein [Candidatus Hydrogenedentota bacterium]
MENNHITKVITDEEAEVEAKRRELETLSDAVAEEELELEELKLQVRRFEHRYYAELGHKYAELDQLRARIATLRAQEAPEDSGLEEEAEQAQAQAGESAREYESAQAKPPPRPPKPEVEEDVRAPYRQLAKQVHPDKADDEVSIPVRTRLMAALNEARENNDIERMHEIQREWDARPESVSGDTVAARLERLNRAIAHLRERLAAISREIEAIQASDIHALMIQAQEAEAEGRDLFAETGALLDADIKAAKEKLAALEAEP